MTFEYYPNFNDPNFFEKITKKKEYYINKIPKERKSEEEICDPNRKFELQYQQAFIKNYINKDTPYQNVLVFWGTGVGKTKAAIAIAENFSEMVEKYDSKIIVLTSGNEPEVNFKDKELLSPITGEKYMTKEEKLMKKDLEILNTPNAKEEIKRIERRVQARIKRQGHYRFMGYEKFVHQTIGRKVKDRKTGKDKKDEQGNYVREIVGTPISNLDNCILIVDEAHRIVNDNDYGESIRYTLSKSINFRLILLTATPLFYGPDKVVELLNLLHLPNQSSLTNEMIFKKMDPSVGEFELNKDALKIIKQYAIGYVSYSRGQDPNTFPIRIDEGVIPHPINIPKSKWMKHTKVVRCVMDGLQLNTYNKMFDGTKSKNNIYLSNMVLPNPDGSNIGLYTTDDLRRIYNAPQSWLKSKGIQILETNEDTFITGSILKEENLKKYSNKYYTMLQNMKKAVNEKSGLIFIYIEDIVGVGLDMVKQILIQNGYLEYVSDTQKNSNEDTLDAITGIIRKDYSKKTKKDISEFKPARFITIFGESDMKYRNKLIARFTSPDNENGEFIKVCLGSRVTRESIDFKNIRQIHILHSMWEYGSIEQIIGRGVRYCSHVGKKGDKREVHIYKYVSSLPSNSKGEYDESLEERIYREEEAVDVVAKKIERAMKEVSIDCVLNKNGNVFKEEVDKNKGCLTKDICPSVCDYQECNYPCAFELKKDKYGFYDELLPKQLNTDTYTINMAQKEIETIKEIIQKLYKKAHVYTIESLIDEIYSEPENKYIEEKYIFVALTEMIDKKIIIMDKFEIPGYIIYKGKYYLFQPLNKSEEISMEERLVPNFDNFKKVRKLNKVIKEKVGKETLERPKEIRAVNKDEIVKEIFEILSKMDKIGINEKIEIVKLLGGLKYEVQEYLLQKVIETKPKEKIRNIIFTHYAPYLIRGQDVINFSSSTTDGYEPKDIIGFELIYKRPRVYINGKFREGKKYLTDEAKLMLTRRRVMPEENNIIVGYLAETKDSVELKLRPKVEIVGDRRKIPSGFVCIQSSSKEKILVIAKNLGIKVKDTDTILDLCNLIYNTLIKYQIEMKGGKTWLYQLYEISQ